MQFIYADSPQTGQEDLLILLETSLKSGQVLWLMSGGSNIEIEVNVLNQIDKELTSNLNVMLVDERYGPSGHEGSNYQKLITGGLSLRNARFIDILKYSSSANESLRIYIKEYGLLKERSQTIIGQLGIGDDGHVAGVLPASGGVSSNEVAVYFEAVDYKRLSLTLKSLKDFNRSYIFCFGENKKVALEHLKEADVTIEECPSLILKEMTDVKVYNDQIKENA